MPATAQVATKKYVKNIHFFNLFPSPCGRGVRGEVKNTPMSTLKYKYTNYNFTSFSIPIHIMQDYPDGTTKQVAAYYEAENIIFKYRIQVIFLPDDGIKFFVTVKDLKFHYFKQKKTKSGISKTCHAFKLKDYKISHNYNFSHFQEFEKTKKNEIIIYPNSIAPYHKPIFDIKIKPKQIFLYFSKNSNRIEIHY